MQPTNGINISKAPGDAGGPQNPFAQLDPKPPSSGPPKINVAPAADEAGLTPMKRERPGSATGSPSSRGREPPEEWEDKALRDIFRLSLQAESKQDSHGYRLHFVGGLRQELEDQGGPIRMTTGNLDQALLEAASNLGKDRPLDYLLGCWKRVTRQLRVMRPDDSRYATIKEARRLCMSYCIFAVSMPDMFG